MMLKNLGKTVLNRHVATGFGIVLTLWLLNTATGHLGRPLDPIYRIVFFAFEKTRPDVSGLDTVIGSSASFADALLFAGWLLVYAFVAGLLLGTSYVYVRKLAAVVQSS